MIPWAEVLYHCLDADQSLLQHPCAVRWSGPQQGDEREKFEKDREGTRSSSSQALSAVTQPADTIATNLERSRWVAMMVLKQPNKQVTSRFDSSHFTRSSHKTRCKHQHRVAVLSLPPTPGCKTLVSFLLFSGLFYQKLGSV